MGLNVKTVAKLIAAGERGRWLDDRGLYLQVLGPKNASWLFRYARGGKDRLIGLGSARTVTLTKARDRAHDNRVLVADGIDPLEQKRAANQQRKVEQAKQEARAKTFEQAARAYFEAHEKKWKNDKHRDQFLSSLRIHAFPHIGRLPVGSIDKDLVLKVIQPIWPKIPETANRVRGRIETVLNYAAANGWRDPNVLNPARWRGYLDTLFMPKTKVKARTHFKALGWKDAPGFMEALRARQGVSARALEFLVLTAARTSEVTGAIWDEIDLDAGIWTVPAMGREKVIICQDNDDRGREHAQQVARQLQDVVRDVRILAFDDVPEHEDVTYWLNNGGNKDVLLARAEEAPRFQAAIAASPFTLPDVVAIPRREWLYHPHYIRGFVSLTLAPGGVGKSALQVSEALAMVAGKPLLGVAPQAPLRVWYLNLEDPMDELHRRFAATAKHFEVTAADIGDRLFINSGRTTPFILAAEKNRTALVDQQVFRSAISTIQTNGIDVMVVDPVVASHRLQENDNAQIDALARAYARIAEESQIAVMLVHHTRKMGQERGTVEDGRGASALLAAARSARLLTPMSQQEARDAGIEERLRRFHFRADHGKANLTPPAEAATWFRLHSVDLGNESRDLDHGDKVGVVASFRYPTVEAPKVMSSDIQRVLRRVAEGGPWRENHQAKDWVGHAVAQALDLGRVEGPAKRQVIKLVRDWLDAGVLVRVEGKDAKGNNRPFVEAGAIPSLDVVGMQHEEVWPPKPLVELASLT